jgi:superfamily I DNA/RNA helicase
VDIEIIYGPPGTGKTTALMNVLEKELAVVPSEEIAFVSFTKEGVRQGVNRAKRLFRHVLSELPYFRTLHSLAFRELGATTSSIMKEKHYKDFSNKMGMNFLGHYSEELAHKDDTYLFFDQLHRNNPRAAALRILDFDTDKLRHIRMNYRKYKDTFYLNDFTDLIERFNKRNIAVPVKVAIIDEAQDLTTLQWKMIWIAFKNCERVYIAGDDDQAIYQWSGADVEYFLRIPGKPVFLRQSYRLPDAVLSISKRIPAKMHKRIAKEYASTGRKGLVRFVNSFDEIEIKPDETYMFLSRNRYFLKNIVLWLRTKGLIFTYMHTRSVSAKNVQAINLFHRSLHHEELSKREITHLGLNMKKPLDFSRPWYDAFNWSYDDIVYYRHVIQHKTDTSKSKIIVDTIHSVKGAEADHVVLLLDITKKVKDNFDRDPDSEHRVFYVGCTRAKSSLTLVHSSSKYGYEI